MAKQLQCSKCGMSLPQIARDAVTVTCIECGATFKLRRSVDRTGSDSPSKQPGKLRPDLASQDATSQTTDSSDSYDSSDPYGGSDPYDSSDPYGGSDPYGASDAYDSYGEDSAGQSEALPDRLPPRTSGRKAKSSGKESSGKKTAGSNATRTESPSNKLPLFIAIGGVGVLAIAGLVGVAIWWMNAGDNDLNVAANKAIADAGVNGVDPARAAEAQRAAESAERSGYVVITEADAKWKVDDEFRPFLSSPPEWDEAKAATIDFRTTSLQPQVSRTRPRDPREYVAAATKPRWEPLDIPAVDATPMPAQNPFAIPVETSDEAIIHAGAGSHLAILPRPAFSGAAMFTFVAKFNEKTQRETYTDHPKSKVPVIDLTNGKAVAHYHWRIMFENRPVLSPDGQKLVSVQRKAFKGLEDSDQEKFGFDPVLNDHCLAVFSPNKKNPDRWIDVAGEIFWMDFVAANTIAALIHHEGKTSVVLWNVDSGEQAGTIELGDQYFGQWPVQNRNFNTLYDSDTPFYRAAPNAGRLSPSGRFLALMENKGVLLVDLPSKKLLGQMLYAVEDKEPTQWYQSPGSMMFSDDEKELFCTTRDTFKSHCCVLHHWNLADGVLKNKHILKTRTPKGLFPSPIPGTILVQVTSDPGVAHNPAKKPDLMVLMDLQRGDVLASYPFRYVKRIGDQMLVSTVRAFAPEPVRSAPPLESTTATIESLPAVHEEFLRKDRKDGEQRIADDKARLAEKEQQVFLLYKEPIRADIFVEGGAKVALRPAPVELDISETKKLEDKPQQWVAPPPFALRQIEPQKQEHTTPVINVWPLSVANTEVATLGYRHVIYPASLEYADQAQRHEVYWLRYDREAKNPIGKPVLLLQWLHKIEDFDAKETVVENPLIALRPDGAQLAICDLEENGRVDVFDQEGQRLTGFFVGTDKIEGIFWGQADRLWILHGSQWSAIDPATNKLVLQRAGNYWPLFEYESGRSWFATWAGTHAELIDIASGQCLNRLACGELKGTVRSMQTSFDQKHLLIGVQGRSAGTLRDGTCTGVLWNLVDGKAQVFPFGKNGFQTFEGLNWLDDNFILALCSDGSGQGLLTVQVIDLKFGEVTAGIDQIQDTRAMWRLAGKRFDSGLWYPDQVETPVAAIDDIPYPLNFNMLYRCLQRDSIRTDVTDSQFWNEGREVYDPRKWPIQVQVKLDDSKEAKEVANLFAEEFVKRGFKIGVGGWLLDCKGETARMSIQVDAAQFLNATTLDMELRMPDGKPLWTNNQKVLSDWIASDLKGEQRNEVDEHRLAGRLQNTIPTAEVANAPRTIADQVKLWVDSLVLVPELRVNGEKFFIPRKIHSTFIH